MKKPVILSEKDQLIQAIDFSGPVTVAPKTMQEILGAYSQMFNQNLASLRGLPEADYAGNTPSISASQEPKFPLFTVPRPMSRGTECSHNPLNPAN